MIAAEVLRPCVVHHLEDIGYTDIHPLGEGGFGDVLAAVSPKNEKVAIKIIQYTLSWDLEDEVWPRLKHANILPVLDVIEMRNYHCKLFVTPLHPTSLFSIVQESGFRNDPNSFPRIQKWLTEILSALDYLHSMGFCHLDLKADNILISRDDSAILCDFSGINTINQNLERLVSPLPYRPPECYDPTSLSDECSMMMDDDADDESCRMNVRGVPYDIWTFGLLVLNVLTSRWFDKQVLYVQNYIHWERMIGTVLDRALQESSFNELIRDGLPAAKLSSPDVKNALDFVKCLLKMDPEERPSAARMISHPFLRSSDVAAGDIHVIDGGKGVEIPGEITSDEKQQNMPDTCSSEHQDAVEVVHQDINIVLELGELTNDLTTTTKRRGLVKSIKIWIRKKIVNAFKKKKYTLLSNEE